MERKSNFKYGECNDYQQIIIIIIIIKLIYLALQSALQDNKHKRNIKTGGNKVVVSTGTRQDRRGSGPSPQPITEAPW